MSDASPATPEPTKDRDSTVARYRARRSRRAEHPRTRGTQQRRLMVFEVLRFTFEVVFDLAFVIADFLTW